MRIYLEQLANEALGIPDGILRLADVVYEEIMNTWAEDMEKNKYKYSKALGKGNSITFNIPGPYTIKDETWNSIKIEINVKTIAAAGNLRYDPAYGGAALNYYVSMDKNLKTLKSGDDNIIHLNIDFVFNESNTWEDVYDFVNTKLEDKVVETLSHELKHAFDIRKKTDRKFTSRAEYDAARKGQTSAKSLSAFNYYVYFTHYVENLVRPVEVAKYLQRKKVTKQEFSQELKNSETYKILNALKNYSYVALIESVIKDRNAMQIAAQIVGDKGEDIDMLDDVQLAEIALDFNFKKIIEIKKNDYLNIIKINTSKDIDFLKGNYGNLSSDKIEAIKDVIADIDRFGNNYKAFYQYEIKKMNMLAEKTLRKLAKLYAYIY